MIAVSELGNSRSVKGCTGTKDASRHYDMHDAGPADNDLITAFLPDVAQWEALLTDRALQTRDPHLLDCIHCPASTSPTGFAVTKRLVPP
jgi:hypothetical protein